MATPKGALGQSWRGRSGLLNVGKSMKKLMRLRIGKQERTRPDATRTSDLVATTKSLGI